MVLVPDLVNPLVLLLQPLPEGLLVELAVQVRVVLYAWRDMILL